MYKITLTILLAIGITAFKKPATSFEEHTHFETFVALEGSIMNAKATATEKNLAYFQKDKDKGKGNKGNNGNNAAKNNKQPFGNKEKGNAVKQVSKRKNNGKKQYIGNKPGNNNNGHGNGKHYKKGHPNFNYVFVNNHGFYSHKNFGQWRSEQARMKHKKYRPVYEYQAIEGFRLILSRNVFLYSETDYKIDLLNRRLAEKRKAKKIDPIVYERYRTRIVELQDRRARLNINISL